MCSNVCVSAVQDNTGALLQEEDFVVDKETGRARAVQGVGLEDLRDCSYPPSLTPPSSSEEQGRRSAKPGQAEAGSTVGGHTNTSLIVPRGTKYKR